MDIGTSSHLSRFVLLGGGCWLSWLFLLSSWLLGGSSGGWLVSGSFSGGLSLRWLGWCGLGLCLSG